MAYPAEIALRIDHADTPLATLIEVYGALLGDVVAWSVEGGREESGGVAEVLEVLGRPGAPTGHARVIAADRTDCSVFRYEGLRRAEVVVTRPTTPTAVWLARLVAIARAAVGQPGFVRARIERRGPNATDAVPHPPLARGYHLITTTEDEVAACYHDPELFFRCHDVYAIGAVRVCTRGLDDVDEEAWRGATSVDTMALARAAKP